MSLSFYNTLTREKEEFVSIKPNEVKMYACGITASGDAHIGHALQAVIFDVIKRYLNTRGYYVTYVRNYTDIDDKIIDMAKTMNVEPLDYSCQIMKKIDAELDSLGVDRPTIESKATECIDDIIELIKVLELKGFAYKVKNGDVFFDVGSFPRYGNFSNRIIDESIHGVRIDIDPNKRDKRDFALWKSAKKGEISWNSPWGNGRPGWHIECSAMSMKYLGQTIDIHGGGKDLLFPHHENEIAQSEAATGKQFANYWVHNGLIKVNGQKMSKSLGNSILLHDIQNKFNKDVIRLTLLQNHYRSDVNIIDGMFEQFEKKVYNLYKIFQDIDLNTKDIKPDLKSGFFTLVEESFVKAMDNDFNTALAIADLFELISLMRQLVLKRDYQEALNLKTAIIKTYNVLGICQLDANKVIISIKEKYLKENGLTEEEILDLLALRIKYKKEKNYLAADQIREHLKNLSIEVKDGQEAVKWDVLI